MLVRIFWLFAVVIGICAGCSDGYRGSEQIDAGPDIFPDYREVTVPFNIAPLNFKVEKAERVRIGFLHQGEVKLSCKGEQSIDIPLKKWRQLLEEAKGDSLSVKVEARVDGKWWGYRPFSVYIAPEAVDSHIAYRLIEPGYELWHNMGIYQRDLESFRQKPILTNRLTDNSCMNCHSFHNYSPERFLFHIRNQNKGTIIVDGKGAKKIDMSSDSLLSPGVYPMWHPDGKYIAFSLNTTRQAFHAFNEKRIEVYDMESDLVLYDVERNKVIEDPRFTGPEYFETFPAWSPDGKWLYFCRSKAKKMTEEYLEVKYGIYRVAFNEGTLGDTLYALVEPEKTGKSAVFPRLSSDGRYLLYTEADYGTFPIWHKEADLKMMDTETAEEVDITPINSDQVESYHAWSSNSRWILFSSRRLNGLYTRLFIAYFGPDGKMHKPFLLPQQNPDFYTSFLKSYNIPEFMAGEVKISPYELEEVVKGGADKIQTEKRVLKSEKN